jgi:hypothetical protein
MTEWMLDDSTEQLGDAPRHQQPIRAVTAMICLEPTTLVAEAGDVQKRASN